MILDRLRQILSREPPRAPEEGRLDSWKEIAAYLSRDVRTAQRWESEEGLPVHRLPGKKRGPVFAYTSDLDSWWAEKRHNGQNGRNGLVNGHWRRFVGAVAGGAAVVLIAAVVMVLGGREISWKDATAGLRFAQGAVSPDAHWLAYTDELRRYLWMRNLQTGEDRLLDEELTTALVWSPDSRRLAVRQQMQPPYQLKVFDVTTGEGRVVAESERPAFLPTPRGWTRDGTRLLVTTPKQQRPPAVEVGFLSLADGSVTPFRTLPPPVLSMSLSPDDSLIAYDTVVRGNRDIYVARTDGSGDAIRLTRHPDWDRLPVFSPDGRYVLFDRSGGSDRDHSLWAARVDSLEDASTRTPNWLADLGYRYPQFQESFTPSGELLVGLHQTRSQCTLLEVDPKTGSPVSQPESDFPELSWCNYWTPDNHMVYRRADLETSTPKDVLLERNIETGEEYLRQTNGPGEIVSPTWGMMKPPNNVPDYRWRFVNNRREKVVYRYDTVTEQAEPFYEAESPIIGVGMSPNADYLTIRTSPNTREGGIQLWLMRLSDRQVRLVATTGLNPVETWSRDGTELAFADTNCLMVMAPEDPEPTRLTCVPNPDLPLNLALWGPLEATLWNVPMTAGWNGDGTKLAWSIPVMNEQRVELWIVDRKTGEHEVVVRGEDNYKTQPTAGTWSYNGRWIATNLLWYPEQEIVPYAGLLEKLDSDSPTGIVTETSASGGQ